jgi:uncharacterized protein (TIGR02246 family)
VRPHACMFMIAVSIACRSGADGRSLRAVNDAYRAAWLAGDSAAVLRLFAANAVLLPHHGDPPVVGLQAIRAFWWPPEAPPTTVTSMDITTDGADASGDRGVLWGRFTLAFSFEVDGQRRFMRNAGTYLMVVRRAPDGAWQITHRMWDDPCPPTGLARASGCRHQCVVQGGDLPAALLLRQ